MPPKGSKNVKEVTPPPKSKPKSEKSTPSKPSPTKSTPKKTKEPVIYTPLAQDPGAAIPIDATHEGASIQAKLAKDGLYHATIQLGAPGAFSLVRTVVLTEGPYEGQQAIILRPAKAFPFLGIPVSVRTRIYGYYFAQKGVVDDGIVIDGKRTNVSKDLYAKTYAEGSKSRVGLLAVNKEIHNEATPLFYAHALKLESTTMLLDFLSQLPTHVRPLLRALEIKTWVKTTSRNALHFLAEARHLQRLRFETGVFAEADAAKAGKVFYADSYKFLEAIGAERGDKGAGVDVLEFGKMALTYKDENKAVKAWEKAWVEEFKENLRGKLR
ncbi:hypothetical protein LTR08_006536 [Meristemomyces frigidus]|nr:hypothetical protein LTR08_006536 [Meristemomyces frigidus]